MGQDPISEMSNLPNECRRQVLACVRRAQATNSAKERTAFAKLAKIWLSLADDLEELDRQLKLGPSKRRADFDLGEAAKRAP